MKNLKKEITFICTDKVEQQCCESIITEAKKRGYTTKITDNKFEKCEIGFYVSHWNFPRNSKLSVIMLHDLGQQHGEWPMMWKLEFWNIYDVAFLPSKEWADMWKNASCYNFVRPRKGAYITGWPKADRILEKSYLGDIEKIKKLLDPSKKTVLYAPSWEWDDRQLEMIESVKDLDVNLIIKQFPWNVKEYKWQCDIIDKVNEKSKNIPNVYILDPSINIYDAINVCDILVSEESSTLYEAMLLDKTVVAVTDWMVPDVNPPRLPDFPYSFAIHTEKRNLHNVIRDLLNKTDFNSEIVKYREMNFPDIGNSAKKTMDVIDSIVMNKLSDEYRIEELSLMKTPKEYRKILKQRKWMLFKYEFVNTSKIGNLMFKIYGKIKCQNR